MAWEWSHSPDAYAYAEERVRQLPKSTLLMILREWACWDRDRAGTLRFTASHPQVWKDNKGRMRVRGFRLPNGLSRLDRDSLAALVWARAEEHRTCSNGGWDCYLCPDGCHTVPFGPEE